MKKRCLDQLCVLALGVLLLPCAVIGDELTDPNAPESPSMRQLLTDPEDGAFDASAFLSTAKGFLPIGTIITEPAVGYGAGLGLMFFHDSIENRAALAREKNGGEDVSRVPPPSITGVFGLGTENGTWGAGLFHAGFWKDDTLRYVGAGGVVSANLDFYGLANGTVLPVKKVAYGLDGGFVLQQLVWRVGDSDFFIGGNLQYSRFDAELDFDLGLELPPELPQVKQRFENGGPGVILQYDTRDNIFTPVRGVDIKVEAIAYDEAFGGDADFIRVNSHVHGFIPVAERWHLGMRYNGVYSGDDTPFYMVPFIELRGVPAMRYQGSYVLALEAELRWDITRRWSVVGFGGAGWATSDSASELFDEESHPAGGVGFRYLLARVFGIRGGMDLAWGEEDHAVYFTVGSPW